MRIIDGQRYLELSELEAAGIQYDRIVKARSRNSAGWSVIDDPADKRRILVRYDVLKPSVKTLVDAVHGEAVAKAISQQWVGKLSVDATDLAVLRAHVLPDGSGLPEERTVKYARACALLRLVNSTSVKTMRAWGYTGASEFYADVLAFINSKEERLPLPGKNHRALLAKARELAEGDALCVVSKGFGNQCARKIHTEQSNWIVSMYAQPTKPDTAKVTNLYNAEAKVKGWPALTENAIYIHLHRPEVQPLWFIGRHGTDEWKTRFEHSMKNRMPSFRDAMWCSDGTKLNYFYQGKGGVMAKLQVYAIIDVYSEAILGYSTNEKENHVMQAIAAKAALKLSRNRPAQWLYDGQSGHTSGAQQDFFTRASKLHFAAQPYNAKSKSIESLFGRLQKQVMRDRWFFTGQNIQAKSLDSKPNSEFILAHKNDLPTKEQVLRYVEEDMATWNSMPHPKTGVARMQMYTDSVSPMPMPLDFLDMVELFWHRTARPIQYTNQGLRIEVGEHRLEYEVVRNGLPCAEHLRKYTNARFFVMYDVEDMRAVRLYKENASGELCYVATAEAKKAFARAVVDLQPGEREEIDAHLQFRKDQQARIKKELEDIRNESGIDPETLVLVGHRAPKNTSNDGEDTMMRRRAGFDDYHDIDPIAAL